MDITKQAQRSASVARLLNMFHIKEDTLVDTAEQQLEIIKRILSFKLVGISFEMIETMADKLKMHQMIEAHKEGALSEEEENGLADKVKRSLVLDEVGTELNDLLSICQFLTDSEQTSFQLLKEVTDNGRH